jgi:hypothetical protein
MMPRTPTGGSMAAKGFSPMPAGTEKCVRCASELGGREAAGLFEWDMAEGSVGPPVGPGRQAFQRSIPKAPVPTKKGRLAAALP